MNQKSKDETRWLARFFGILVILLGVWSLCVQCLKLLTDFAPTLVIAVAFAGFLCWLGYKLLRCSSLWNIVLWSSEYSVTNLYLQSQYYRINPHIRAGIVGGIIVLITLFFLPVLKVYGTETWFYELSRIIWKTACWPLKQIGLFDDTREAPIFVFVVLTYFFILGFILGIAISFLKKKFRKSRNPV